ncbi:MAG: DPP IV N-terminal domain-containing protein, partial [Gemmatimonadaceae bacterium]|nr:DPP IV N-terminal domain-containing protein [Gemmatimonadaceae bacterium]
HTHRVFLVCAGRPAPAPRLESVGARLLELSPLSEEQVTEVIVSLAALPNDPWAQRFPAELWRATTGSPLWVLKTLQDFVNRSLLARESETWTTPAPQQVLAELKEGGAPRRLIENLDPSERWLTLVLAIAGRPLDDTILLALGGTLGGTSHEQTHANLDTLESQGIAIRLDTRWQLTHEEISDAAIGMANADVVREAHAKLGREISERTPNSLRQIREAARHFALAGDETSLQSAFSRFVLYMRSHGDHRSIALLADDLLGSDSSVDCVRRLTKSLPLHFRLGLTSGRRVAAALVAAVLIPTSIAVISLAMTSRPARNAEAELTLIALNDESAVFMADVPLFADEWIGGHPIKVSLPSHSARRSTGIVLFLDRAAARPGGLEWVVSLPAADSGVNDLFLATRTGLRRRLTYGRGDDAYPSWSPDGRFLAFATARWRSDSHYDLDILDLRDGTTRALARGDPTDRKPRWNPTGTTIAFLRDYWDGSSAAACVIAMDGNDIGRPAATMSTDVGVSRCVRPQRGRLTDVLAWFDEETLVVRIAEDKMHSVVFLHFADGAVSTIDRLTVRSGVTVSPDGRWVACQCVRPGQDSLAWFVLPSTRPNESRPLLVESDDTGGAMTMVWAAPAPTTAIESVDVKLAAGAPRVGVPYQLQSVSRNRLGRVAGAQPERWSSSDTSAATVERWTGLLKPRRAGRTTVSVSLAGGHEGSSLIVVTPNDSSTVFTETWNADIEPGWRPYGTPRPSIRTDR